PVDYHFQQELGEPGVNALRQRNATSGNQFLKLKQRPAEIDAALYDRMRQLVTLAECKGMGIGNASALETLRITRLDELARQNPSELTRKLHDQGRRVRLVETMLWIREADRIK